MFQTLLSPLRSKFDLSPRSPQSGGFDGQNVNSPRSASLLSPVPLARTNSGRSMSGGLGSGGSGSWMGADDESMDPEEFAREVLIELMRAAVEEMKGVAFGRSASVSPAIEPGSAQKDETPPRARVEIMTEIHRIMQQDQSGYTKSVFREMDGFLCLMSVLSDLSVEPDSAGLLSATRPATVGDDSLNSGMLNVPPTPRLTITPTNAEEEGLVVVDKPLSEEDEERNESLKWVFLVLMEALEKCPENEIYFRTKVGYHSLKHALKAILTNLPSSPTSLHHIVFSYLLEFSLSDTSAPLESFFVKVQVQDKSLQDVDVRVKALKDAFLDKPGQPSGMIRHAGGVGILWDLVEEYCDVPETTLAPPSEWRSQSQTRKEKRRTRYALYKLLEMLFSINHRNGGILSSLGIVGDVFNKFTTLSKSLAASSAEDAPRDGEVVSQLPPDPDDELLKEENKEAEKERHILQRLLRRLLEMGATTGEARGIFQAAIRRVPPPQYEPDGLPSGEVNLTPVTAFRTPLPSALRTSDLSLDQEILDVIRFGVKSRWVEHFSMEGRAAVVCGNPNGDLSLLRSTADSSISLPASARWKGLPKEGITFMIWFFPCTLPQSSPCALFSVFGPGPTPKPGRPFASSQLIFQLSLRPDGKLQLLTSGAGVGGGEVAVFSSSLVKKNRWTHLSLVHYPHRGGNPNIRLFIDGAFIEGMSLPYPKSEPASNNMHGGGYVVGDLGFDREATTSESGKPKADVREGMSWCLSSAYLLGVALPDDIPRLIHHLGPRYTGTFQDRDLKRFLTYEASTSLNMYLASAASLGLRSPISPRPTMDPKTPIVKALRDGMSSVGLREETVVFIIAPSDFGWGVDGELDQQAEAAASGLNIITSGGGPSGATSSGKMIAPGHGLETRLEGDVFVVKAESLDVALWKIGGAAVALWLVRLASTAHELSRTLGILTDGLKNSWQNSEDMERLRGYEILGDILRSKATLINLTTFETLFEFLGINFNIPEHSTVVNMVAYRTLALDFSLWSRTRTEIQRAHLDQFMTLVKSSKYKAFNVKQRLSKMSLLRKLLFTLQTDWYSQDMIPFLVDVMGAVMKASFGKDDTIKPVVAYLAANLHETSCGDNSPQSIISRFEIKTPPKDKAERVLSLLVSVLSSQVHYTKFTAALPINRILLLLLGDRPSPFIASRVLNLIAISIAMSNSFSRKFELVSGWSVLKTVLPSIWDPQVNKAAFDLLLGRTIGIKTGSGTSTPTSASRREDKERSKSTTVTCTQILPTIISALRTGLIAVANNAHIPDSGEANEEQNWTTESTMELLIEELLTLHASSSTFRQIFESQQTTQLFIDTYTAMVDKLSGGRQINSWNVRILEKLTHFGLALALDNAVGGGQKREILDKIQFAEAILNPSATTTMIDPGLVVDNRSVRQRIASARFSMQVGERTVIKTITRMTEWRKTVQASEKKRLRKTALDIREHRRQISRLTDWTKLLTSERGLWPHRENILWRLDETEGPNRIRKKLEPQNDISPSTRVDGLEEIIRDVHLPDTETASVIHVEVPPWSDSYEISATEVDDRQQLAEDIVDDKLRRVRHELEPGDVIEAVATVARIDGVDSSPGLLILGRTHIYMLDGVVESEGGEVIDAHDAPKRLLFVPGSIVELDGPQKAQRWPNDEIATCSDKKFLFRDVGIEIYFKDSRSLLIVFLDKKRRSEVGQRLSTIMGRPYTEPAPIAVQRTPLLGRMGSRMLAGLKQDELSTATRKWQAREISNFTYLSILNQISGRTPSDATQYPVFPWVIADYTSQILDLNNPKSYRDLTKPMGAQTPARRQAAETRYSNLQSVGEEPFHYGTHFSSSMIVCHFLIRLAPFTNMFKTLQGGDWDLPDRLFSDLPRAYDSAANDIRGDVRELIPEFFTCPEFLENSANHDFGTQQSGERIHDVKLPPWAHEDPFLFITMNRRALESTIVSEQLPAWIDLIWGCNQRDPASLNVFHPLSYEGSIDLDSIKDDLEREATVGIIHNFGQTPRKLFTAPHPERDNHGLHSLPLGTLHGIEEDPHLLSQNARCFRDLGPSTPVRELVPDYVGERMIPCPEGVLCLPQHPNEHIEWRSGSTELRVVIENRVTQVIESAYCTCAAFADAHNLVTGSSDYTVRLWKISRRGQAGAAGNAGAGGTKIALSHIMRVHTDEVVCVAASRAWSLVVSGSKDGSAAIWDLNKGVYVRSIWHGEDGRPENAVNLVAINESTGYIATCSRLKLCLHTINGRPIATLDLTKTSSFTPMVPTITSLAFHEREYSQLGVIATGGPDGSITLRTWTADGTPDGEKAQWEFLTIRTMKVKMLGHNRPPAITALRFLGEQLYHGEETGKSYVWSLPDH
ncbi:hypothetical protein CVT24_010464 [Panaeolus cyanescens]|uniref:Beach-domain-containing protein n=1 Tax=Panaeolus cyanescens TaxID=181874 RepID=A0A409W977_9AGAR|nr:hypothetical protein CVT24_010464 [Panaeolus cyanescens]